MTRAILLPSPDQKWGFWFSKDRACIPICITTHVVLRWRRIPDPTYVITRRSAIERKVAATEYRAVVAGFTGLG